LGVSAFVKRSGLAAVDDGLAFTLAFGRLAAHPVSETEHSSRAASMAGTPSRDDTFRITASTSGRL
jgi:hypothetical protein